MLSYMYSGNVPVLADRDHSVLFRYEYRGVNRVAVSLDLIEQDGSGALRPRVNLRRHRCFPPADDLKSAERRRTSTTARNTVNNRQNAHFKTWFLKKNYKTIQFQNILQFLLFLSRVILTTCNVNIYNVYAHYLHINK